MAKKQYLDIEGLKFYDGKIKTHVAGMIAGAGHLKYKKVATLPAVASADAETIYLVPRANNANAQNAGDAYDEYLLIDGVLELIGNTEVDFSNYYVKGDVDTAISTAKGEAIAAVVGTTTDTKDDDTIKGAKKYADSLVAGKNVEAEGDGVLITASASNNKVSVAPTDKTTAAISAAETSIQEVTHGTDGDYIALSVGAKSGEANAKKQAISASLTIQAVESASASAKGLAEASDVKTAIENAKTALKGASTDTKDSETIAGAKKYADELVGGKNVSAEGDDYVGASASDNKVTIATTDKTKNAVAAAETSVQELKHGTDGDYVALTVGAKTGDINAKEQTISASLTIQPVSTSSETAKGLVEASDVKNYVDTAVSGLDDNIEAIPNSEIEKLFTASAE